MAISLRSTSTGTTAASSSATTVAVNKPSGLAVNDVMVAGVTMFYSSLASSAAPTGPSGWTAIGNIGLGGRGNLSAWYRVADSADVAASTFTWTFPSGQNGTAASGISTWKGVNTTSPIDASAAGTDSTSTTATSAAATTVTANARVLRLFGLDVTTGTPSFTTAAGNTEEYEVASGAPSSNSAVALDHVAQVAVGDTGTATSTVGGTQINSSGYTVVLRPAVIYVEGGFTTTDNAASLNYVGNAPSGIVAGELLIAHVFVRYVGTAFSMTTRPTGWNIIDEWSSNTTGGVSCLYWKEATGSEPSSYTWIGNQSQASIVSIGRLPGASTTNPINVAAQRFTESTTSNSHAMPSVSPTVANTMYVGVFTVNSSFVGVSNWGTLTAGWVLTTGTGQNTRGSLGGFESIPATGATGTRTVTTSDVFQGISQAMSIAPAGTPTPWTQTDTDAAGISDSASTAIYRFGTRQSPDAILSLQGLTGTVSEIQDDPDSSDANWLDYIP